MKKKFYVAPEMEELLIETEGFLAASAGDGLDDGDPVPTNPGDAGDDDGF